MVEIRTDRLLLRDARADDMMAFHAILSDRRATRYWYRSAHDTLADTREWLDAMIGIAPDDGEDFAVEIDGRLIGKAGFRRFPTIGFIMHPDHWGRGLAAEAVRSIIARALDVHRLSAIDAEVDPRNEASLRLLRGFGFIACGRSDRPSLIGSEWCDSLFLRLRANRWTGGRSP